MNQQAMYRLIMNDYVSTYGLLRQTAVKQESAMHRKFKFHFRNKPKHS